MPTEALVLEAATALVAEMAAAAPAGGGSPEDSARRRLSDHGLYAYDPAIPDLELARAAALLTPFEREVEQATGAPLDSFVALAGELLRQRYEWLAAHVELGERAPGTEAEATRLHELLRAAAAGGLWAQIPCGLVDACTTTADELAASAGVPVAHVERFCDLLALDRPDSAADMPFARFVWRLRRRPVVRWGPAIAMPLLGALLTSLRPALEAALRTGDDRRAAQCYVRAKGRWLEARAVELLTSLLPVDEGYRTLTLRTPAGRQAERDALLYVDLCALAIEVKGLGIPASARGGDPRAQERVIERLIRASARQAEGLVAALRAGSEVTGVNLEDGRRTRVRARLAVHWIPLVLTLEDVGGVAAGFRAAFGRPATDAPVPLVLSLDDLDWYGRELELPAALLHYLAVRTRAARSPARMIVVDEADWFRMYLHMGSANMQTMLDMFAEVGVAALPQVSDVHRGMPETRAPVWRSPHEPLLRGWQAEARPGWLEASFALLDLSLEHSAALAERLAEARDGLVVEDDVAQLVVRPRGNPSVALHAIATLDRSGSLVLDELVPQLEAAAGGAELHVVLASSDGVVENLQFLGVVVTRPGVDGTAVAPSF